MKSSPYQRWRAIARVLLARGVPPEAAHWDATGLLGNAADSNAHAAAAEPRIDVPRQLVDLLERAACHRDPLAAARMYRALWRVTHGERKLLDDAADDDVIVLTRMAKAVDRAAHKMTAFVRFRELHVDNEPRYVAWFEPEHDVLTRTAPFFVKRFAGMVWTIATPDGTAHWDRRSLVLFERDASVTLPREDAAEALWLTYYESIFNPARLNLAQMRKEMPSAYWKNLPEAARIPALVARANARASEMIEHASDRAVAPYRGMQCGSGAMLAREPDGDAVITKAMLDRCRRCELGASATQAVGGQGPRDARIMLVGEQPGDEEDLAGEPFIGPAGRLLREALSEAELDASKLWITNAVKHFSFQVRGKRRIHKTPLQRHVDACRQWLEGEIAAVAPGIIVTLGATALRSVLGASLAIAQARGSELRHASGARVIATYHPAAILRAPDVTAMRDLRSALVSDLRVAAQKHELRRSGAAP